MGDKTGIEWTDATWNPTVGCTIVSPGCTNCYAMRMAARLAAMGGKAGAKYAGLTQASKAGPVWTGAVRLALDALDQPLRWRRPRRIFVNSMSDLFHEDLPYEAIDRVFAIMALAPQHIFQVLTKRPERMRRYCDRRGEPAATRISLIAPDCLVRWPLPNVWFGVSVEDQRRADERIPILLDTPAAVRWISAEPLLGPLDLINPLYRGEAGITMRGYLRDRDEPDDFHYWARKIDWVVAGGESGPGARPMHPDWARSLRDQCVAAGVPFLFKQWGSYSIVYDRDRDDPDWRSCGLTERQHPTGRWLNLAGGHGFHGNRVVRAVPSGKRAAGRELDGRTWDQYPATPR